jgi:pantothenate kinase
LDQVRDLVTARLRIRPRLLIGLAGPPGAGKSTLAGALAADLADLGSVPGPPSAEGVVAESVMAEDATPRLTAPPSDPQDPQWPPVAVTVPLDGFHLSNAELARLGLADRKGAPETFDAFGFVHLVRRVAAAVELIYAPAFDHAVGESIGGAIPVDPRTRVVVVEGNYLLLPTHPWSSLVGLFDLTVYLEVADDGARVRDLLNRHVASGRSEVQAREWIQRSDEKNARLIAGTRDRADVVLTRS